MGSIEFAILETFQTWKNSTEIIRKSTVKAGNLQFREVPWLHLDVMMFPHGETWNLSEDPSADFGTSNMDGEISGVFQLWNFQFGNP